MTSEQAAWSRLQQKAPRRQYEHVKAWEKRNRRRANFARRVEMTDNGCWIWRGQSSLWRDRVYPVVSFRERPGNKNVQRSAFAWLVHEFVPEFTPMTTHRTVPGCGQSLCINPWHRRDRRVTRQSITADQARAIYAARGSDAGAVAEKYGISRDHVLSIWRGRNWSQVTGATAPPKRRKYTDADVQRVLNERGTGSSYKVAARLGVHHKFVQDVWSGKRNLRRRQTV